MWWIIGAAGILLVIAAIACVIIALNLDRRVIAMRATGTLSTSEVERLHRAGERGLRCEISGVIECDSPLTAPMSNIICVAYSHQVVQHVETGVYSDFEDTRNNRATFDGLMPHNREYTQIEAPNDRRVRFYVRDASGRLLVDPAWATMDMPRTNERYESITSGVDSARPETVGAWNTEDALALGSPVYVLGYLGEVYGEAALICHASSKEHPFVISHRSERELEQRVSTRSNLLYLGSGVAGVLGGVLIWLAAVRLR
jgi:hypothetical protein